VNVVLKVDGLEKSFRRGFFLKHQSVLKGISFQLPPGTITGFLGANGAGKTTTIKCVLGLSQPDCGGVRFFGDHSLSLAIKNRIGFLPERPYFYEYLTGEEFLRFYGQLSMRLSKRDLNSRIDELLLLVGLSDARHRRLRAYSKGMLQRIGFAQAVIHKPDLVILDEPVSGMDPDGRAAIADLIRAIAKQGASVFFSSHLMHDAERLCQRLVILREGKVMFEGSTDDFLNRMGVSVEILAIAGGQKQSWAGMAVEESQRKLSELVNQGAQVLEVRQNRKSLEDAFIETALRGKQV